MELRPGRTVLDVATGTGHVALASAQHMARRLAREEGIFAGTSTGANVAVALKIAAQLPSDSTVVTLAVDSGLRYLSTELFK